MTILAGAVGLLGDIRVTPAVGPSLAGALSRRHPQYSIRYETGRACLVKYDIGAFPEPGWYEDAAGVSVLVGDPILRSGSSRSRQTDLVRLHEAWSRGDPKVLKTAAGVFAVACYSRSKNRLSLMSDKLGLRPLYYWFDDGFVVFASAQRILEALPFVPKVVSAKSVAEMATMGYPLGRNMPYVGWRRIGPGEIVEFDTQGCRTTRYWRWDEISESPADEKTQMDAVYHAFSTAIDTRRAPGGKEVAFLSGGLDSRCIVALLRNKGSRVETYNLSERESLDWALGERFAEAVGAVHTKLEFDPAEYVLEGIDWAQLLMQAWEQRRPECKLETRPSIVWSGDGGSVGLGAVYHSDEIARLLRLGRFDEAFNAYLRGLGLPKGVFRKDVYDRLWGCVRRGFRNEFRGLGTSDPARSMYLFLLLNDQRRHLTLHFENIDLHRLEFHLPFYDSEFLDAVARVPIDRLLHHRFYCQWLANLPAVVCAVPWQSYPGHVPCPLSLAEMDYQWGESARRRHLSRSRGVLLARARELVLARGFPHPLMSRWRLVAATALYHAGVRDYGYLVRCASTFHRFWVRASGRYSFEGC